MGFIGSVTETFHMEIQSSEKQKAIPVYKSLRYVALSAGGKGSLSAAQWPWSECKLHLIIALRKRRKKPCTNALTNDSRPVRNTQKRLCEGSRFAVHITAMQNHYLKQIKTFSFNCVCQKDEWVGFPASSRLVGYINVFLKENKKTTK